MESLEWYLNETKSISKKTIIRFTIIPLIHTGKQKFELKRMDFIDEYKWNLREVLW